MNRQTDPRIFVRRAASLAAAVACLVVLAGCSDIAAQLSGPQSSEPLESVGGQPQPPVESEGAQPQPTVESEDARPVPALQTVNWGTVDGLLSVVVANRAQHTLSHAVARLTALDANGREIGTPAEAAPGGRCCTVADLPPGGAYGFYFDLGPDAAAVAAVEMTYQDISWATVEPSTTAQVQANPVGVEAGAEGAVVVADVATPGPAVASAVVQAYLVDGDGRFVAVVSGRWSCFAPGGTRRVEMQLFHPVPDGTSVHSMVAYPSVDAPDSTGPSCPA